LACSTSISDSFLDKPHAKTQALKIGGPLNEAMKKPISAVSSTTSSSPNCAAMSKGAKAGGHPPRVWRAPSEGGAAQRRLFAIPTVFAGSSNDWRLAREEIFGPMLLAIPWRDEADAIRIANDSHYALVAYGWTHDIGSGLRAAHAIESGWVQVNQGLGQVPGHSYGG